MKHAKRLTSVLHIFVSLPKIARRPYTRLVEALCSEHGIDLIKVPSVSS